jgi:uncharacterized protein YlxW (UPF0749 family)
MKPILSILVIACAILGYLAFDFFNASNRSDTAYQAVLADEGNLRQSLKEAQDRETAANAKISDLEQKLAKDQQAASLAASAPAGDAAPPPPLTITNSAGKTYTLNQTDYDRLLPQSQALDKDGAVLDQRKAALDKTQDDIHNRSGSVDTTNADAVNQFNAEIDKAKATQTQFNEDIAIYNSRVNDFNAELERVAVSSK